MVCKLVGSAAMNLTWSRKIVRRRFENSRAGIGRALLCKTNPVRFTDLRKFSGIRLSGAVCQPPVANSFLQQKHQ
jgi:hypothetical protein